MPNFRPYPHVELFLSLHRLFLSASITSRPRDLCFGTPCAWIITGQVHWNTPLTRLLHDEKVLKYWIISITLISLLLSLYLSLLSLSAIPSYPLTFSPLLPCYLLMIFSSLVFLSHCHPYIVSDLSSFCFCVNSSWSLSFTVTCLITHALTLDLS